MLCILFILLSVFIQPLIVEANPAPITRLLQPNVVVLAKDSVVEFRSENVNITIGNLMDVHANYTLVNPTNETVVQNILLPYIEGYLKGGYGDAEDNQVYYSLFNRTHIHWERISLNDPEILEVFDLKDPESLSGFVSEITMGPYQKAVLQVRYTSPYETRSIISDHPRKFRFSMTYIVRSTEFWRRPLESARIDIWIPRERITDIPVGGGTFELLPDHAHVFFEKENWMPDSDINIWWNRTEDCEFGEDPYGNIRRIHFNSIGHSEGWMTYYNLTIIDGKGEPIWFLDDGGRIVLSKYQTTNVSEWSDFLTIYLIDKRTPPGDLTISIQAPGCHSIMIPLDGNLSNHDIGDIRLVNVTGGTEDKDGKWYLSTGAISFYLICMIGIPSISVLLLKRRQKKAEGSS